MLNRFLKILTFLFINVSGFSQSDSITKNELYLKSESYLGNNNDSALFYVDSLLGMQKVDDNLYLEAMFLKINILKYSGNVSDAIVLATNLVNETREEFEDNIRAMITLAELNRAALFFENGIYYLNEVLAKLKGLPNNELLASAYNRMAAIVFEDSDGQREHLTPLYADSSVVICKQIDDPVLLASNYEILGAYYRGTEDYVKAGEYLQKAYEAYLVKDTLNLPNILINMALNYGYQEKFDKAIEIGEKAYAYALEYDIHNYIENNVHQLARICAWAGRYEEAYEYIQAASGYRLNLYFNQKESLIAEYNQKFEAQEKEYQIEVQRQVIEKQLFAKRMFMIASALALLIVIGVLFLFLKIKKSNKKLAEQKVEIETQKSKLENVNHELVKLDTFKKSMSSMLAHDLKNSLSSILHFSKSKPVIKATYSMHQLIMNFLDVNRFEDTAMRLDKEPHFLSKIVEEASVQNKLLADYKSIKLVYTSKSEIEVDVDKTIIVRVLVNLVDNAIKYSRSGSQVKIEVTEINHKDKKVEISVVDNGKGIADENINKVFDKYFSDHSTGLGLAFCKMAIEEHGGTIGVESELGKQTRFYFTLPLLQEIETSVVAREGNLVMSESDKKYLFDFAHSLSQVPIYQVSTLRKITKEIQDQGSGFIGQWKEHLDTAIYNCDDKLYNQLIEQVIVQNDD